MDTVLLGVGTLTTLVGDVVTLIFANPLLATFTAASLVGVAIGLFRKFKGASH